MVTKGTSSSLLNQVKNLCTSQSTNKLALPSRATFTSALPLAIPMNVMDSTSILGNTIKNIESSYTFFL